jgi:hypothetical protein
MLLNYEPEAPGWFTHNDGTGFKPHFLPFEVSF